MRANSHVQAFDKVGSISGFVFASGVLCGWLFCEQPVYLLVSIFLIFVFSFLSVAYFVHQAIVDLRYGEGVLERVRAGEVRVLSVRLIPLCRYFGACEIEIDEGSPVVVGYGEAATSLAKELQSAV